VNRGGSAQFQVVKLTPVVKNLIIANVAIWLVAQLILDKMLLSSPYISHFFSLNPSLFVENFMVWQPLTYMFLHSSNIFHILFNMISLWFFGSDLETRWGGRPFLIYYLVSGAGAALIYLAGVILVGLIQGTEPSVFRVPVIGASGAVFGVLVAFAILFGERVIYFFGVFPMKAKFFIMIMAGIEIVTLLNEGMASNPVANLAHIGGMIAGFLYLVVWTKYLQSRWRKGSKAHKAKARAGRNLRLVVNNKDKEDPDDPKYWN